MVALPPGTVLTSSGAVCFPVSNLVFYLDQYAARAGIGYADVIVRRWQEATGEVAVLEGETCNYNEIKLQRSL